MFGCTNARATSPVSQLTRWPRCPTQDTAAPTPPLVPVTRIAKFDVVTWRTGSSNVATPGPCSLPGARRVAVGGVSSAKVAVTLRAWSILTEQVSSHPEHAPAHPSNWDPGSGVAVSVRLVPAAYFREHAVPVPPQSILPSGELVTVPCPSPVTVVVSV